MKIVLQNVLKAKVIIDKKVYSEIEKGYVLLVSFNAFDNEEIAKKMAIKISKLRIFADKEGKTNLSIFDVNGSILSISQFTLYANLKKGNRPSFIDCMDPIEANRLYEYFNNELRSLGITTKTGIFGADMKVELINDGPFTLVIDSEELK